MGGKHGSVACGENTQSALGVVTHTMGGNNVLECWDLWAKLMAYGANTQSNIGFV